MLMVKVCVNAFFYSAISSRALRGEWNEDAAFCFHTGTEGYILARDLASYGAPGAQVARQRPSVQSLSGLCMVNS